MGKRLLSKDYDIIVQETFAMPDNDLKKYYLNTVEENISDNPDIFIQLKNAIQRELNWYLNLMYMKTMTKYFTNIIKMS